MDSINSYSYYDLHEKIALVSLLRTDMRKQSSPTSSAGSQCIPRTQRLFALLVPGSFGSTDKKQANVNNNNNNNNGCLQGSDEASVVLQFHVLNVSRERSLHLSKNVNDKRLVIFYNVSNGLYKLGLRNGE